MRYALLFVALILGLFLSPVRAAEQPVSADDKAFFDKQMGKLVKFEPKPLAGDALGKVFAAKFFKLGVSVGADGMSVDLVVAKSGDNLLEVTTPSTTADMPDFKTLFKPDFKLKTDADAKSLQAALDLLYPIDERFSDGKEDIKAKTFKHTGTTWTFIRGKFFDDFKGFIVKIDANGTVTSVEYSLNIKK